MSEFNIEVQGGSSVRLPTSGKYCEKDIIVTASGGGGGTEEIENIIDESGVLESTDGTVEDKVEQLIDKTDKYNNLKYLTSLSFKDSNATVIKLDCADFPNIKGLEFSRALNLTTLYLSNTKNITTWTYCFYTVNNLIDIYGDIDLSSATNISNAFQASKLRTISFVPETIKISIAFNSSKLTDGTNGTFNSIQSIIDGLATVETAQTLTLNATVKAKLTETQLATITSKNWNLA